MTTAGQTPTRHPSLTRGGRIVVAAVVAAAVLTLAACGGSPAHSSSSSAGGAAFGSGGVSDQSESKAVAPVAAAADGAAASAAGGSAQRSVSASDLVDTRRLVRTATLSVTVGNVFQAAQKVRDLVAAAGGYVGDEQTSQSSDPAPVGEDSASTFQSTLVLRVPPDHLGSVTTQVSALGTVTARGETTKDVTQKTVDVASRLATQKASVARIRTLLSRADKIGDIVAIESELSDRESALESLEAQLKSLNGQVDLSTLTVYLSPPTHTAVRPARHHRGFGAGLSRGWDAFGSATTGALTAVGAVLPFAALLALVGTPVLLVLRRRRPGPVDLSV